MAINMGRRLRLGALGIVMLFLAAMGVAAPMRLAGQSASQLREGSWYPNSPSADHSLDLLRSALARESVIGYAGSGPIKTSAEDPANAAIFFATQYAMVPILLDPVGSHTLVLMNMPNSTSAARSRWLATSGATKVHFLDRDGGRALVWMPQR